jgi:hypothetical protein
MASSMRPLPTPKKGRRVEIEEEGDLHLEDGVE